ncbi:MAG: paraquat-inducible protein A [Gammaproteobacteria bacterium]|nr:paraquat-inducible protein A [Gammaproteobacteria bacterium]
MRQLTRIQRILVQLLLLSSLALLLIGVFSPLIQLTQFWFFTNQTSLASAIVQLFEHGEWLLAGIVAVFSVVFPIIKTLFTLVLVSFSNNQVTPKQLRFLAQLGKWSMLDVFIVALIVTAAKLGALAEAEVQYGLYLLLVSTLLNLCISVFLERQSD